jgi:hypothetical protein
MIQPSKPTAADKALASVLVQIANDHAEQLHRLSTIDEMLADDFVASMFENAEVIFAIWPEGKRVGFLCIKGVDHLSNPETLDPEVIDAIWVQHRAMAFALKEAMQKRDQ